MEEIFRYRSIWRLCRLAFESSIPNALQKHPPDLVENALRNSRRGAVKYKTLFEPVVSLSFSSLNSASLFYISVAEWILAIFYTVLIFCLLFHRGKSKGKYLNPLQKRGSMTLKLTVTNNHEIFRFRSIWRLLSRWHLKVVSPMLCKSTFLTL